MKIQGALPTKNVITLVVTGILGGGATQLYILGTLDQIIKRFHLRLPLGKDRWRNSHVLVYHGHRTWEWL